MTGQTPLRAPSARPDDEYRMRDPPALAPGYKTSVLEAPAEFDALLRAFL